VTNFLYQWFACSRRRARDAINQLKHYKNGAEQWFYMYDADDERVWSDQPPINGLPSFDRWTLRGLDAKVRRTFELYGYNWGNAWRGSNLWEDYVYRDGLLLASYSSDGYQRHIDVDHLGTPRVITRPASGQAGGFYTLTPCRILDTRQTGAPLTQINPQWVYQISGACGVPANAQAVALNVTLVTATANLSLQGYPGDLPAPGAPGTNVVSASPPGHSTIAAFAVLPLATNGSGTLGVLMTLAPPATSGQTDLILDVSGYFAPASTASVEAYHVYLPFGAEATNFAQDFERMKFTGHERDLADPSSPADDLDYMHARHYNFLTGRFLSVDWHSGSSTRPQSWNRYSYAWNTPMRLIDPNGLDPLDPSVRTFFESYYSTSFANVEVHSGWFARLLAGSGEGITFGEHIFLSHEGWQYYQSIHQVGAPLSQALEGMNLIGHELTHTLQARESGLPLFLIKYLYQWAKSGFDYPNFPFEQAAFAKGNAVEDFLAHNPDLLESIRNAGSVSVSQSPSQWSDITSISGGPFEGPLALSEFGGTLYIEGVNLTGVFSWNSRF
jgi:RHS repeat-associated protein